jgi:MraZ protein
VGRNGEQGSTPGSADLLVFIGRHDRSLDDKGRLVLPTTFRRDFEDAGGGVLAPWDRCLGLWTKAKYGDVMEQIIEKVREGEADDDIVRLFQSDAADVQLDAQGRFVVPEEHRRHAGIARDVRVLGQTSRVEIWDAGRFDELKRDKSPDDVSTEIRRLHIF